MATSPMGGSLTPNVHPVMRLMAVPGIGPARIQRVFEWAAQHGASLADAVRDGDLRRILTAVNDGLPQDLPATTRTAGWPEVGQAGRGTGVDPGAARSPATSPAPNGVRRPLGVRAGARPVDALRQAGGRVAHVMPLPYNLWCRGLKGGGLVQPAFPHTGRGPGDLLSLDLEAVRTHVRRVLAAFPEVAGAYLFGSALTHVRPHSDIDIAVITTSELPFRAQLALGGELEARLGGLGPHPFHVTILDSDENTFAFRVLHDGELIHMADAERVTDVIEATGRLYDDLAPFRATYRRALGLGF